MNPIIENIIRYTNPSFYTLSADEKSKNDWYPKIQIIAIGPIDNIVWEIIKRFKNSDPELSRMTEFKGEKTRFFFSARNFEDLASFIKTTILKETYKIHIHHSQTSLIVTNCHHIVPQIPLISDSEIVSSDYQHPHDDLNIYQVFHKKRKSID